MSDELVVSAFARSDARAYGQICTSISPRLVRLCERLVGRANAEDLAQDVLLRVWERRSSFDRHRGSFDGWVHTITRNAAVDHHRADARCAESWRDLCEHEKNQPPYVIEAGVMARLSAQDVRRSVARLPEAQRRVIWDAFWTEKSHREIAASSNLPLGTIKGRIRLGLTRVFGDLTAPTEVDAMVDDHVLG
jgi:RNA polymerase sigma-70 factor, ECF subfamily